MKLMNIDYYLLNNECRILNDKYRMIKNKVAVTVASLKSQVSFFCHNHLSQNNRHHESFDSAHPSTPLWVTDVMPSIAEASFVFAQDDQSKLSC